MAGSGHHILLKPSWARVIISDLPRGGERVVSPRCRPKITGVGRNGKLVMGVGWVTSVWWQVAL